GLNLRDSYGNTITMTENGNLLAAATSVGQLNVGTTQFQIGANAGQTAGLSLGNFASSQLGSGVVSGLNLSNLDITSGAAATQAMQVIDKAIEEVSGSRGAIGNFMRNTLESQVRNLGVAKENLAASESAIRDADVAEEMTKFTKLQILQQSGLAMLAQANSAPQSVLSLLR
ncbi:MAG: flagellin, partial [Nitrospirae bacterium]|nr:flagellin [Fimbriimonadaceae bacterium]